MPMTDEQEEGFEKIEAVIRGVGYMPTPDDDEYPEGGVFLNQWVLMAAWVDEEGNQFLTRMFPKGTPAYAAKGLLAEGLNW